MTQHTPEQWHECAEGKCGCGQILGPESAYIATVKDKATRRRIVACVNACAGVETEVLESVGYGGDPDDSEIISDLMGQRDKLQAQVDELLAAAKHLLSNAVINFYGEWQGAFIEGTDLTEYCQPLQDAINKITGEPK